MRRRLLLAFGLAALTGTLLAQTPAPQSPQPNIFARGFGLNWVEQTKGPDGKFMFKGLSISSDKMTVTGDAVALGKGTFEFTGKTTVRLRLETGSARDDGR